MKLLTSIFGILIFVMTVIIVFYTAQPLTSKTIKFCRNISYKVREFYVEIDTNYIDNIALKQPDKGFSETNQSANNNTKKTDIKVNEEDLTVAKHNIPSQKNHSIAKSKTPTAKDEGAVKVHSHNTSYGDDPGLALLRDFQQSIPLKEIKLKPKLFPSEEQPLKENKLLKNIDYNYPTSSETEHMIQLNSTAENNYKRASTLLINHKKRLDKYK